MHLLQVAQRAADLPRARDFYAALLETSPSGEFDPPGLVFFDLAGVRLLLDRGAPSSLLYYEVPSVEDALERARLLGAHVEAEPHLIFRHDDERLGPAGSEEWHAFVRDPEGNLVGLVELRPADPDVTLPTAGTS